MRSRGVWGEELVAKYLRDRHYEILAHSYRSRFGEIDLIAADKNFLAFVEVKLRKYSAARASPQAPSSLVFPIELL